MSGFIGVNGTTQNEYDQIISWSIEIANNLQDLRVINGGNMYLAPAAFNLTNSQANDTAAYLNNINVTEYPDLFDYFLGNTYALGYGEVNDPDLGSITKAYDFYKNGANGTNGLGNWAKENNMKVIITEFGIFSGNNQDLVSLKTEATKAMTEFCNDSTVEGVLFFRPLPDVGIQQTEHQLVPGDLDGTLTGLKEVIGACTI
ncbi:MAG: hypothetical protein Q9M91_07935 [Candidatus Dojkabacteria bacterium]|nr:hypothetical protein [Candidatus Dojkabacteria bacterium]